jgi:hypothetical protein
MNALHRRFATIFACYHSNTRAWIRWSRALSFTREHGVPKCNTRQNWIWIVTKQTDTRVRSHRAYAPSLEECREVCTGCIRILCLRDPGLRDGLCALRRGQQRPREYSAGAATEGVGGKITGVSLAYHMHNMLQCDIGIAGYLILEINAW